MKKYVWIIAVIAVLLTACKPSQVELPKTDERTPAKTNATQPTSEPATEPSTEPTADPAELEKFNALFGDFNSWYNKAVGQVYDAPEKLDLQWLFGTGFKGESTKPTDEEWKELEGKPGFDPNYELFRLPAGSMDDILVQYFGISLEDVEDAGFEGLEYLESTDCYYFMGTGVYGAAEGFQAKNVQTMEDGTVLLSYTLGNGKAYEVGLKPIGEDYMVLFNRQK